MRRALVLLGGVRIRSRWRMRREGELSRMGEWPWGRLGRGNKPMGSVRKRAQLLERKIEE